MNIPRITFWRMVAVIVAILGLWATFLRFTGGIAAVSNMSDVYPWGLWIGFDVMCGVGLAAGGFTICAVVFLFNLKRFKPVTRPAILTAYLGYLLVCAGLIFDLGRPWRIWHPLVHWNPHSVMFEVGWCVTLYTTVLTLEFAPIVLEKFKLNTMARILHKFEIPIVILGVTLSTLHQSSLGSLFLIAPEKLHPLWWTTRLPLLFYTSAIGAGLAMVIFESRLSSRLTGHELEMPILSQLGKGIVMMQFVYLALRLQDLFARGVIAKEAFKPNLEAGLFWLEILGGSLIPALLLMNRRVRTSKNWLPFCATLVVLGFMLHRLDVGLTANRQNIGYFPSFFEFMVSAFLVAIGFFAFAMACKFFPVFPKGMEEDHEAEHGQVVPIRIAAGARH